MRQQVEDGAAAILGQEQPLIVPEILARLRQSGVHVGGGDPEKNLSSYLSRSPKFVIRRKEGGWFLAAKEAAPAGGNQAGA